MSKDLKDLTGLPNLSGLGQRRGTQAGRTDCDKRHGFVGREIMTTSREGWQKVKIGQIGRVVTGKTPPTKRQELYGGEYPFITPTDISEGHYKAQPVRFLSEEGHQYQRRYLLPRDTVCYTCIASIGKICMTTEPSFTNQQINSIVVDSSKFDYRFIYHLLRYETERIRALASGAAAPIINKSAFSDIELFVPPLPIQRKIASVLFAYDDLIENNTRRIAILEEMAQALYREWFVHFRFPGHEQVALVDSELGPIPEGWGVKCLGDITEEVRRSVEPEEVDPETPYFGLEHLPRKSIALSDWGAAKDTKSTKLAFKRGEVLFGKIRPYFHKVGVAPVDGICSTDTIVIVPKLPEYFSSVLACVSSEEFVDYATLTSQGTKMPRADWKVLVRYPVAIPPGHLLSRFNTLVQEIVVQIQNMIFRNWNLRRTRDLLLPRLISGEVDVSDLEINMRAE
jgi:type I restriction enzyme S subunit